MFHKFQFSIKSSFIVILCWWMLQQREQILYTQKFSLKDNLPRLRGSVHHDKFMRLFIYYNKYVSSTNNYFNKLPYSLSVSIVLLSSPPFSFSLPFICPPQSARMHKVLLRYVQSDGIFQAKSLLHSKWNAKVTSKFPTPGTIKQGKGSECSRLFYGAWICLLTNPGQWVWLGEPQRRSWELCQWCVAKPDVEAVSNLLNGHMDWGSAGTWK